MLIFGPTSKAVRMLAMTPHNQRVEKEIAERARLGDFMNVGVDSEWHPASRDAEVVKDLLGLATGGRMGSGEFETVIGSWSEDYQVLRINKTAQTVTVNFKAHNDTDWRSFCHDHACSGKNISSGVGVGIRQEFYWTKVLSLHHLERMS